MNPSPQDRQYACAADEREFEAFAQAQDLLDIDAATWVARRHNGLTAAGEAELQDWLAADPRHAEAFADMDSTFGHVRQLPDHDVASLKAGLPQAPGARGARAALPPAQPPESARPQARPQARPTASGRRPWLPGWGSLMSQAAVAAMAFVMVGGGWMGWERWRQQPTFEQAFATERGQQWTAALPDAGSGAGAQGSTLQLDTATRLEVRLYRDRREVHLTDGQAMFKVSADAQRPFHVWAGALRITVKGTRFSVRHTQSGLGAGRTIVVVEEGRVGVSRADLPGGGERVRTAAADARPASIELTAGQTVEADAAGQMGPVASVPAARIAPWRSNRISFDQTPLAQAIAEFERYGRTGLVVRDPAVAALPVGGSYRSVAWQRFAQTLPQVLPVRLVRRGGVTEVVAR